MYLDGIWPAAAVTVQVPPRQAAYLERPFEWQGQAGPTTLELQRTGVIRGWVTIEPEQEPQEVVCSGEGERAGFQARIPCRPDGSYEFSGSSPAPTAFIPPIVPTKTKP